MHAVAARLPWLRRRRCRPPTRSTATSSLSGGDRHDADAGAEPEHPIFPGEAEVAHRLAQRLGGAQRLVQRASLEQHAELVAAEARQRVAPAHLGLQQRAHLPEQRIAGAVAAGVVDDLELVEVEVAQRVRRLAGLRALQRTFHAALELAPVDQAGQQVVAGVIGQAPVQLARSRTRRGTPARRRCTLPAPSRIGAAVLSTYSSLPSRRISSIGRTDLIERARRIETRERVLERLAGLLVEGTEDLVDRPTHRILEPPAGQLLGHRVQVVDRPSRVGGDHAVADRLQRDLRALLLAEQRLLVELALGDVELDADQAQQPALRRRPAPWRGSCTQRHSPSR